MSESIIIIIIILIILIIFGLRSSQYVEKLTNLVIPNVTYKVTYISVWGEGPHINYPKDPHTGNMFFMTHTNDINLFRINEFASDALSKSSQYGTVDDLVKLYI